jgi:LPS O-antigen subunit length determinant protein (WzzB/FepE family)
MNEDASRCDTQGSPYPTPQDEVSSIRCYEDEIDLTELVAVLWRRRWFMLGVLVVIVGLGIAYCLLATPKYEISAQVMPGITDFKQNGEPIREWSAKDLATWFQDGVYTASLSSYLREGEDVPEIDAKTGRQATFVSLTLNWSDPARGKEILKSVLGELEKSGAQSVKQGIALSARMIEQSMEKARQDKERILLERKRLDDDIQNAKGDIQVLNEELDSVGKNAAQSEKVISRMREQVEDVNRNTKELIQLRSEIITADSDKFALLMYSNIIQQNITYLATLEERVASLDREINEYRVQEAAKNEDIAKLKLRIDDLVMTRDRELPLKAAELDQEIQTLQTRLETLSPVEIVQPPFSSIEPVRPAKKKIMAVALALGGFAAILGAFLREFWVKNRDKISAGSPGA